MPGIIVRLFAAVLLLLPLLAQAQIAFRAAATGTALVPTFRAASTSGGVVYRGSATTPAGATSLAPVYRAAAAASSANGVLTLTVNRPAGTLENDVMVAAIGVSGNAPVIIPPAGWVLVRRMTNAAANANSLAVYYKVATAAEPANYAWTFSASGGAAGGIQTFYNVDILAPIDAESGQTTPSSTSHTTPGIVTTVPNTMLVTAYTFSSSRAWNNPPLVPAAPAVTERIDVRSNGNNATGQSTAAHQGVVAAAGVVPALTATAASNADVGNTHVLALRPALRVPRLATTAAGEIMIAAIGVQPSTATVTAPAGWTLVRRINNAGPTSNSLIVYRKFAAAGEPSSYLWQFSGTTDMVAGIQTYAGVDPATPVDAEAGAATASSLTHTAPSITTTVDNAMLVAHYTFASAATWMPQDPPGPTAAMTEVIDVASRAAPNAAGQSLEGARSVQATAGGSASFASQASANADAGATHIMALRPGAYTIPLPAGTAANDVLIASIGVAWSGAVAPVITPPAGWTLVRRIDNNNPTRNSLAVFNRTAAAGEPGAYTFGVTNAAYTVGGIQCFYNVDPATPIDVEAGQSTPSSNDHATPTIATTVPNTLLVGSYTYASSRNWTPQDPDAGGPLVAMTESFDRPSGAAANSGQSIEGTRLLKAAAGAVPAYTSRAAGGAPTYDRGNTHILALRSANPLLVINKPAGTVASDVMIASIGVAWNGTVAPVATPPAGWTLVRQIDNATATRSSLFVYRKVDGGAEPASYTWNFTNFSFASGGIQSFSGVDTTTPVDVENGIATASALTHATPSVTTTVANAMLVTSHTYASSGTWAPPAGMTEGFDVAAWTVPNALGQSTEGSFVLQAGAGATGARTATASASADRGNAHILALRPTPVTPTPDSFNAFEVPSGFTCATMGAATVTGPIRTKIAGTGYSLCVVALNNTPQILTGFSADVSVEVLARDTVGPYGTDGCPSTNVGDPPVTVLSTLSPVTLTSGRALVAFPAEASARRDVRIRISYPTVTPTVTRCSGDNHAIRPLALTVTSTTANADNTGVSVINVPAIKAGGNFSLTATALSSYNGTPAIDATKIAAHAGAVQTGSLGGSFDAASAGTGVATGTTFTYSEVGYFNFDINGVYDDGFTAVDQPGDCTNDFSNTLVGGKYGCKFGNTAATDYFGRFIPDHFGLATFASDSLIDRSDINTGTSETCPTCCPSAFTYLGEDFKTRFELSARNAANTITQNYTGGHAKFGLTTWSNFAFTGSSGTLVQGSAVPSGAWGSTPGNFGIAVVTATHRAQRPASPVDPYTGFAVSAQPTYTDGTQTVSLAASTQVHTGNTEMRFGRLRLQNALGSELRALPVPVWAEHWSGTAFTRNTQDSCTVIGAVTLSGAAPCTLTPAVTGAGSTLSSGAGILSLAAPGVRGCADLTVTVPDWLKGRWSGATYTQDPTARATFGVFRDRVLYRRENY